MDYIVPDVLDYNLKILFCGTAPSRISAKMLCYYGNKNNKFWKTLFEVGFTDKLIRPVEYTKLLEYRFGLTDLVKNNSGNDEDIEINEEHRKDFEYKIMKYNPKIIAFTSKNAAYFYFRKKLHYGLQKIKIFNSKVFVLPSTSPLASKFWDISYWEQLKDLSNG
jgi:TDG/mug DNA glycosylase family protein